MIPSAAEGVVLLAVLASVPLTLVRPFFGILAWSVLAYTGLAEAAPSVARIEPTVLVALATVAGVLVDPKERLLVLEKRTLILGLLAASMAISALLAIDPGLARERGGLVRVLEVVVVALLTTGLVRTRDRLRWLLIVVGGSLGVLALGTSVGAILDPHHEVSGPGGLVGGIAGYSVAMAMAVPLLVHLVWNEAREGLRFVFAALAVACVIGVVVTGAAAGILALSVVAVACVLRYLRHLPGGTLVIVAPLALALAAVLLPMDTIESARRVLSEGPSTEAVAWEKALDMARHRPVFGVGPGNFESRWSAHSPRTSEAPSAVGNTYLQVLAESGVVTFALLTTLLALALRSLCRLREQEECDPWRRRAADGTMFALAAFAGGALVLPVAHFALAYHLVAVSVALEVAEQGDRFDWFGIPKWWDDRFVADATPEPE